MVQICKIAQEWIHSLPYTVLREVPHFSDQDSQKTQTGPTPAMGDGVETFLSSMVRMITKPRSLSEALQRSKRGMSMTSPQETGKLGKGISG